MITSTAIWMSWKGSVFSSGSSVCMMEEMYGSSAECRSTTMIDSTRHATAFSFIPFVRMMFESSSYALRRDETPASSSLSSKNSSMASSLGASTSWLAVFSKIGMIMSR